jgi:DNA-binding protein YbaB
MDNDAARHNFTDVLALVQDQMRDLSDMQQKRSALSAKAKAADGTVEVSVDAQGMVTGVVIDDSYLDEFELADLGGHITGAAREAAQDVGGQAAALLEPLTRRRDSIRALSDVAVDVPELGDVLSHLNLPPSMPNRSARTVGGDEGWEGNSSYPSVRS